MKDPKTEILVGIGQGFAFVLFAVIVILAAMLAGCDNGESVRPEVDNVVVDETVGDEDAVTEEDSIPDEDAVDEELSDTEDEDSVVEDDADEDPDVDTDVVISEEGWSDVWTAGTDMGTDYYATTCGLYKKELYCWGRNTEGQFGNGTLENSSKPVPAGVGFVWKKIVMYHTSVYGITEEGLLYRWGETSGSPDILPVQITTVIFTDLNATPSGVRMITELGKEWGVNAESEVTVIRDVSDGYWPDLVPDIRFWSNAPYSKLGLLWGGRVVVKTSYEYKDWPNPVREISEIATLTQIEGRLFDQDTGAGRYYAVDTNKVLWYWSFTEGVYEEETRHEGDYPIWYSKIMEGVVKVSSADTHTCAVTFDKKLYCWGANKAGQLGMYYESDETISEPQEVIIY